MALVEVVVVVGTLQGPALIPGKARATRTAGINLTMMKEITESRR